MTTRSSAWLRSTAGSSAQRRGIRRCDVGYRGGKLLVSAFTEGEREAYCRIAVKVDKGPIRVAYNYRYILAALQAFSAPDIEWNGITNGAGVFRVTGSPLVVVVMIMFLNDWEQRKVA